jgi:hypothetical protein
MGSPGGYNDVQLTTQVVPAQTYGEWRVGLDFNPSGDDRVGQAKRMFAELVDHIDALRKQNTPAGYRGLEQFRLLNEAIDDLDTAAMKVVKALTKKNYEQETTNTTA